MRAAAATAIAFLACHPIGAKGDECMWGPYRVALLEAGALRVLLEAALAPTRDETCRKVIEKAAAVGVMYLCTVVSHYPPLSPLMLCARSAPDRSIHVCTKHVYIRSAPQHGTCQTHSVEDLHQTCVHKLFDMLWWRHTVVPSRV